jgi:hypothetical protein
MREVGSLGSLPTGAHDSQCRTLAATGSEPLSAGQGLYGFTGCACSAQSQEAPIKQASMPQHTRRVACLLRAVTSSAGWRRVATLRQTVNGRRLTRSGCAWQRRRLSGDTAGRILSSACQPAVCTGQWSWSHNRSAELVLSNARPAYANV